MTSAEASENFKIAVKALLKSVEGGSQNSDAEDTKYSCKPLIRLFEASKQKGSLGLGLTPKQHQTLLIETIQNMSKKQANRFFSGLKSNLETILAEEAYVPASAFEDEENNSANTSLEIEPDKKSTECLHFLKYTAMSVEAFVEGRRDHGKDKRSATGIPLLILPQVYDVAVDLHNILFSLHTCGSEGISTQDAVLKVCETWWLSNGVQKETLIAQCLPLLVLKALDDSDFQNTHIKRLFKLKDAFLVIDFTNASSDSLRSLLLRIASNPLLLRLSEGKKFLACLLQDPCLVKDLHLAFRAQIPETKKTVLLAYGEIYYRAWKDSLEDESEDIQEAIEHDALQDLMHASIHLSTPSTLNSVLTVLETIFNEKKNAQTAEVLYRLYNPILWRSLSAANPSVRKNAVVVLQKVFPLHNPATNQTKEAVEKGTAALKSALQDKDPSVRIAAAEATADVCGVYWDALPSTEIQMLLNHVVMGHASDTSSAAVRVSALEAISNLLVAPQSHAVLRALLPSMGNLIHDKTARVRLAAVKMLLKVKETRGIRFYHVVPVDHLTARLSEERRLHENPRNPIAKELTCLLLSSYFPQGSNVSGADQLKRTLTFFLTDPSAAFVFYANLVDILDVESVVKFIVMLLTCLKSAVDTDQADKVRASKMQKKRRRQGQQTDDVDAAGKPQNLSASNTALMVALAETISMLVESAMPLLKAEGESPCNALLLARFGEIDFINILTHFEQMSAENNSQSDAETDRRTDCMRTSAALLRCMAQLPRETVDGMVEFISSSMAAFGESPPLLFVLSHLAPLCVWGMTEAVVQMLAASIESAYDGEINLLSPNSLSLGESMGRRRSSTKHGKKSGSISLSCFSPDMAWAVVNQILRGSEQSTEFMRDKILSSEKACSRIETALEQGIVYAERLVLADTGFGSGFRESYFEYILCSCEAYGKFVLHKVGQKGDESEYRFQVKKLLDWTSSKVLPAFLSARPENDELRNLDISRISNVSDSLVMSPPRQKANLRRTPTRFGRQSPSIEKEGGLFLISSFTATLLQSACVIFADEIAIGSSRGDDIAAEAVKWCIVFNEADKESIDGAEHILKGLFPSFLRLAFQLCKSCSNFMLLKELLIRCDEDIISTGRAQMKQAIASLLRSRFGAESEFCDSTIAAVLIAASEILESSEVDLGRNERAESVDELWSNAGGCLKLAINEIVANRSASQSLAKHLVSGLSTSDGEATKTIMFKAKFLSFLMTKSDPGIASIIRDLNLGRFQEGGDVRSVLREVLGAVSA